MRLLPIPAAACVLSALVAAPAAAQHHHPENEADDVGRVEFPVSCDDGVRPRFERAVAMMHSFWFAAAAAEFAAVAEADPACGMAHWGRAVTLMGNPMTRASPPESSLREGLAAAERAWELTRAASHREQMYADAVLAFYRDYEEVDHGTRMGALEDALKRIHEAHPEDREAAILYARTLVANAPPDDHTFARQLRAGEIMQPLFDAHPKHPGLAHYLIHAYDAPQLAQRGQDAALAYASIAPAAPHALHMPSHIFTRLGYWDESIETNMRSAEAEPDPDAAVHPMDYMVYAYLQQGRDAEARRVLARAVENPDRFYGGMLGYNFTAMPARYALERDAWEEAASLKLPVDALPYVEAITRFARAVGAARSGDTAAASEEVAVLAALEARLQGPGDAEWAARVRAQRLAAAAWIAHRRGEAEEAVQIARDAAELEEAAEKHPVTPGPILPARELEGDLLLELGRYADALASYERTLEREPRRARALYGAARAAELGGDAERAAAHYGELLEVMTAGDPGRQQIAAAREYLRR